MKQKINLQEIPKSPGCYLFKNRKNEVIYVGKAKDLSKRVKSYFQKNDLDTKTKILVSKISFLDFIVTDNEFEALVLENNLIKKHKPRYNIDLKDSKRYAYIQITSEELPRLLVIRKPTGEGNLYGPFVSAASRDYVASALRRIFKIRTCKKLPKRECLRYSLGLCSAPCTDKISKEDYLKNIRSAEMVLKGKISKLVKILSRQMKEASKKIDYEKALELKNQIIAVKSLKERQKVERQKSYDEDLINYKIMKDKVYLILFNSRKGILENRQDFELEKKENFLEDFIVKYYSQAPKEIPREIILPEEVDKKIPEYLSKLKGKKVVIEVPKKGDKKNLIDLIMKNLEIMLLGDISKLEDLRDSLKLNELPAVIECFDISHLSGTSTVGSMVQFRNSKPDKNNYRRFKIRTVGGIDDYKALQEVVRRRYTKLKKENLQMPNLVVIDGGKGQLSSVLEVFEELEVKLVVISLAKRDEEIFIPGRSSPIVLSKKSKALKLLQSIRDEAHRFAIKYNRLLRSKKIYEN